MPRCLPRLAASLRRRLEAAIVREHQRLIEDRGELAAVIDGADRRLVGHRRRRDEVAAAQLGAVDAGDARGLVHRALEHVVRLRPAGAAIGPGRHRIGEDAPRLHGDTRDVVHRREAAREIVGLDMRAVGGEIGAHAGEVADAQRQEKALVVERKLGLGDGVARLIVGQEGFRPRRHPVHRPSGGLRRQQQSRIFRIGRRLHAEGAADILGDHAQALRREPHDRHELVAQRAGTLRTGAQRVAAGREIIGRGGATRLHRRHVEPLVDHRHARDMRGTRDRLFDRAGVGAVVRRQDPVESDVARRVGPDLRRAGCCRLLEIDDGVFDLVVDRDQFGRVLRGEARVRDHRCDRLADMAHVVACEDRAERLHQLHAAAPRHRRMTRQGADPASLDLGGRQHREHAGSIAGFRGVHGDDARRRVRRAHEICEGLAGGVDVIGETAAPAHQTLVLDAWLMGRVAFAGLAHVEIQGGGRRRGSECAILRDHPHALP